MEEKELKTSPKQRIFIAVIAIVMLGSMIAGYAAIILGNSNQGNNPTSSISEEKKMAYEEAYNTALSKFRAKSQKDFDRFAKYMSAITGYNDATANDGGVKKRDYVIGDGRTIGEDDYNYLAYYVGWCSDEKIFDSTLNNTEKPTSFDKILTGSAGMIEGWLTGIVGMKLNGIREITIPSSLAYKDQDVACGPNKPLKFLIMTKSNEGELKTLADEVDAAYMKHVYASQYGIDYETLQSAE